MFAETPFYSDVGVNQFLKQTTHEYSRKVRTDLSSLPL